MPTISIVIPIYKVEQYLERCINSILNQSYKDIEMILVDDGSPDNCGKICDEYSKKYGFIKTIHKENEGLGFARNTGIENASGKFITFIDSDDYIADDFLKDLIDAALANNADTVIASYSRYKNEAITPIDNPIENMSFTGKQIFTEVLCKMLGPLGDGTDSINMAAWRVLYSMDIIQKYNLRFPSERQFISEDIIFNIKYYQYAKCVRGIGNCGYIYCLNEGSLTERYNPERYFKGEVLYFEKKRLLEEAGLYTMDGKYRTEESFIRYSRYAIKSEYKFVKSNGKKAVLKNLGKISSNANLTELLRTHSNPSKSIIDRIIDYCLMRHYKYPLYYVLKLGYAIKGGII